MIGFVYFMRQISGGGPVKIGHSYKPEARIYAYNTMSPYPLEIVALFPGDITIENRFHILFSHLRSHHEWFRSAPELEAVIADVQAGTFDADSLPTQKNRFRAEAAAKGWVARRRAA